MKRIPFLAALILLPACGPGLDVLPSAPTNVQAVAGNASATVTWSPPATTGGRPILQYVVTVSPGGATQATPGPETSLTFTGLTPGLEFTFTVAAINAAGTGPNSAPSNAVTIGRQAVPVLARTDPPPPANQNSPRVIGTAGPNDRVVAYGFSGCNGSSIGEGQADATGAFSVPVAVPDNVDIEISAVSVGTTGERSACSNSVPYVEDSAPPGAPAFSGTAPVSPSPQTTFALGGSAEAGARLQLYPNAGCSGAPVASPTVPMDGHFTVSVTVAANSSNRYSADAVDAAGNRSACSTPADLVSDDIAPPVPALEGPTAPTSASSANLSGHAEAGARVELYTTSGCTGAPGVTGTADGAGAFSIPVTLASNTSTDYRAVAVDAAGNRSGCSAPLAVVQDSLPPAAPAITGFQPESPATSLIPVVMGTAEPGSTVQIFTDDFVNSCGGTVVATAVTDATGHFSTTLTFQSSFTAWVFHTVAAWATDAAFNRSACSQPGSYIWDTLQPTTGSVFVQSQGQSGWTNSRSQVTVGWSGFSDYGGVALSEYRVFVALDRYCSSPIAPEVPVSGSASSVTLTGLSLQEWSVSHTVYVACVRAIDHAGNSSDPLGYFFSVDATPPVLVSRTPAPGATGADSWEVDVEVTDDNLSTANSGSWLWLEAGGGTPVFLTPQNPNAFGEPFRFIAPQRLEDGMTYTAHLTGVADLAGNAVPDTTWTFTVGRAWRAPVEVRDSAFVFDPPLAIPGPVAAQVTATDELHIGAYWSRFDYVALVRPGDLFTRWRNLTLSADADVGEQTMAFNSAGSGVALYTRRYSPGPRQVAFSFHEMLGSLSAWWWEDTKLDPNPTGEPSSLSAAVDSADVSYMVWVKQAGAGADLWTSRFDMDTFTVDPPSLLETAAGAVSQAAVAVSDQDLPVAAWLQVGSTGTVDVMSARRVAGSGWTTPAPIESQTGNASALRLAVVDGGQVLAMWQRGGEIWWNRYLPGTGWGTEARLGTTSSAAELRLTGRHGTAVAVWRQDPSGVIQAAVFAGAAGTWSAVSTLSATGCSAPNVSLDGAGNAGAVFLCGNSSVADVMGARYAGGSWGAQPRMVAAAEPTPQNLQVLLSESGDGWALWNRSPPASYTRLVMTPYR